MSDYCSHCETKTGTEFNLFMVGFCAECNRIKSRPGWSPVAYECHICGRHDDESYPGQRVCERCAGEVNDNG